jgi:CRP-like cAMP-binding protein
MTGKGIDKGRLDAEIRGLGKTAPAFPEKMPLHDGNFLIDSLPPEDRAALLEISRPFDFPIGQVFCDHGETVSTVEFIEKGVVSAVFAMKDGRGVEAYMVGREGVTHPMALESTTVSTARLVSQIAGSGRRVDVARLATLAAERPAIRDALIAYAGRLLGELEQSTACNALHKAEQRFAKWLLRCHDRTDGDILNLTQEFLANMLGAQRTTVNEAAQQLQKSGAIRYMRGSIQVKDRIALERASCECYAAHYKTLRQARVARGVDPD